MGKEAFAVGGDRKGSGVGLERRWEKKWGAVVVAE